MGPFKIDVIHPTNFNVNFSSILIEVSEPLLLFLRAKIHLKKILTKRLLKQKQKTSTLEQKLLHWSKAIRVFIIFFKVYFCS